MSNTITSTTKKISNQSILLLFGGFCLLIALILAWMLGITLFYPHGELAGHFTERADIIRAHVDYLMMAQFLLLFFVLFRQFAIEPPLWQVIACCYGAFFNPLAFLMRGISPKPDPLAIPPEPHFPLMAAVSFSMTSIGFLSAVVLVALKLWQNQRAQ